MDNEKPSDLQARLERVVALCHAWTDENPARAVVVYVARGEHVLLERGFGTIRPLASPETGVAAQADTIFLVASLTKPLTAAAVCLLVDRGEILLDDSVSTYLPEFGGHDRQATYVRHLLTHTSGLPDMLPENVELRQGHALLSAFIERTCATKLLFAPGTDCRYQSMGVLLAAALVERVVGRPLPEFLQSEILRPLGMKDTYLGVGTLERGRMARVILPAEDEQTSWNWNSEYWRGLAAPWGGLHATAGDYARFLHLMLAQGVWEGRRVLSAAMTRAMLSNQIAPMPGISAKVKLQQAWGLGWRLNQPAGTHSLPEIGSSGVFGHAGATGTVAWADHDSRIVCVILTNDPTSSRFRSRLSNLVAGLADV